MSATGFWICRFMIVTLLWSSCFVHVNYDTNPCLCFVLNIKRTWTSNIVSQSERCPFTWLFVVLFWQGFASDRCSPTLCLCPLHRVLLFHSTFHVIKGTKRDVWICLLRHTHQHTPKWTKTTLLSRHNSTHLFTPALPSQPVSIKRHGHNIQWSI